MEEAVRKLLRQYCSCEDHFLEHDLTKLADRFGEATYEELLKQLTGKNIGSRSRHYWQEAVAHRNSLEQGAPHRLSIRASLFDLLYSRCDEFKNPVFIEAESLENIRLTSVTDGLTGLYNQTYFKSMLGQSLSQYRRSNDSVCSLILLDLDHFKQYNDRCGHLAGDEALKTVAQIIRGQVRDQDVVARYGGEEFAVYLPNATKAVANTVAGRIRHAVETALFAGQQLLDSKNLTVSGGIAVFPHEAGDAKSLIKLADKELYKAKCRRNSISPSNCERRRDKRHPARSLLEFSLAKHVGRETAIVYDVSNSGIGIWSNQSIYPDDRLTLRFTKPFWTDELQLGGFVRQVFPATDSELNYVGIQFDRQLDDCTRYLPKQLIKRTSRH